LSKNEIVYNLPRECVHHFFHSHKCFVFDTPARSADLHHVEELPESQLCEGFVRQAERFCDYVYVNGQPKTHAGGHPVTGRMLGNLTVMYVDSIRSGSVPCMENAVLALAQIENTAAIHEALSKYEDLMGQVAKSFPTESQEQFLNLQKECEKEAVGVFMDRSFKDDKREYQAQLMSDLLQKFGEFSRYNEEASAIKCGALIQELSSTLERRLTHGDFCKPGGHKHLLEEKQKLVDAYNRTPGKGIK
ncbi:hypothetical protein FKM82_026490, partial [Ascaphus truei]